MMIDLDLSEGERLLAVSRAPNGNVFSWENQKADRAWEAWAVNNNAALIAGCRERDALRAERAELVKRLRAELPRRQRLLPCPPLTWVLRLLGEEE